MHQLFIIKIIIIPLLCAISSSMKISLFKTRYIYSIHVQYYPQCIPHDHIDVGLGMGLTPLSTPRPLHPVHHSVMLLTM